MNFATISNQLVEFAELDTKVSRQFIREAIKDICDHTWVWTEIITFLTTAGTYEYTLTPATSNVEVIGIPHQGLQIATVNTPQPSLAVGTSGTLVNTTTYAYQVTAYKGDYGESLPCDVVSLAATATGEIVLTWAAIPGAEGYYIYGNNGSGAVYSRMTSTTDVTYDDDGTDTPDGTTIPPTNSILMRDIKLTNEASLKAGNAYWRQREGDSIDFLIYDGIDSVRTSQVPKTSGIGFQVTVVIKPTTSYNGDVPTILERNTEIILEYVRYRVYMDKGSDENAPYYNRKQGLDWQAQYHVSRTNLKTDVMAGFGGEVRAKHQHFAI